MSKKNKPEFAPGIDDREELNRSATPAEIERGESTEVTRLAYDENDPS